MLLHVASMLKDQKNACNILLVGAFNPSEKYESLLG